MHPEARIGNVEWLAAGIAALLLHAAALALLAAAPGTSGGDGASGVTSPTSRLRIALGGRADSERSAPPGAATASAVAPAASEAAVAEVATAARTAPVEAVRQRVARAAADVEPVIAPVARSTAAPDAPREASDVAAGPPAAFAAVAPEALAGPGQGDSPALAAPGGAPGGTSGRDTSGSASSNSADSSNGGTHGVDDARAEYFEALFARVVSSLDYPRRARLEQVEGVALLAVRIDREGAILRCDVAESSGSPLLDRHALRIAHRAAPFGPVPAAFGPDDLVFELPIEFALAD